MIQSNLAVNISPPSIVNFTCSTLYNSTCDQQQATSSLAGPENDFFYYSGTPLPAFSIIQNVPYCSGGTNVNLAVTPSVPSFTYLWSQGASTSNNINVTTYGNYTVTITSSTCASNVVVHHLVENNIINLSLTSNPSNSCASSSFYTLENSSDPGTGVVGQPLYTYSWSYSGGGCTTCSYPYTTPSGSGTGPFSVVASYNGCTAAASITIPNVTPSFTIIGGGNYCEPFSPTLSVNFGSYSPPAGSIVTYMWSTGATTPTINATAPKNGGLVNYSLTITVDGCSANANVDVINLTPEAVISFDDHMQGYCSASQINVHSLYQGTSFVYNWSASPAATSGSSSSYMLDVSTYLILPPSIDITLEIDNQGCVVSTTKAINDITPSVQINSISNYSHANLCPGENILLKATTLPNTYYGGTILYNYLWSDGATTASNSLYPPGNPQVWTYTVTVTNQNISECNSQHSFQIFNMDPKVQFVPPVIPILPGGAASLVPLITNSNVIPNNCTYFWTYGVSPLPLTPTQTAPQQIVSPSATTTYYLDLLAHDPFDFNHTCASNAAVTVAITGNIACPGIGYTLLTQPILNGGSLPANTHWWVKDQLYVSGPNLSIGSDVEIVFSKGSGITIASNHYLQAAEGCVMRACGSEMWDGIYMQPNSQISLTGLPGHPVRIEDAEHGLFAAGSNISVSCMGDVTFDKNYISIHLENGNFNSAIFDRTKFKCSGQLLAPHAAIGYTYRHAELINAGIVNFNTGGSYVSNLFENAYTGIYSRNTSVNVKSCSFINSPLSSQPNYIGTGIDFNVRTWSGMTTVPTLNVGQANTSILPNEFEDFELSIASFGRAHVNIIGNRITNGNQAIRIRNNSSLPAYLEGDVYVSGNIINNVLSAGIILSNNQYTRTTVLNNSINPNMVVNIPVNPLLETTNGIFIHNATPTTSEVKELFVQWNTMVNCKNGIHVMNHNGGHFENNIISYFVDDIGVRNSTSTFRRGIKLEGCKNLFVSHNTISRPLNSTFTLDANMVDISSSQVVSLCGIFSGSSQNCAFANNILNHLPTGFHLNGNNADNQFSCNHLFQGIEGFKLANVFMSNQGSPSNATGNDWVAWPNGISSGIPEFTRIMGTGIPNHPFVNWYRLTGNPDHDPEQGVFYNPAKPSFIQLTPIPISNCDDQPCFDCEVDGLHSLISFADTALTEEALKYAIENYVYTNLKDSMQLMHGGTIWDASLQNFFTLKSMSNLGLLNDVENLLTRDEYATSYILNNEIETTRLVENNLYEVNRVCAAYNNEFDSLSIDDRLILETIAYQYPDIGGTAVYRARAILGLEIDDSQLQYRLSTKGSSSASPKIVLFPNPARDFLNMQFAIEYPKGNLQVSIYNVFGKLVDAKIISDVRINPQLDVSKFLDGVYLIKINDDENCLFSGKFVKIAKK